MTRHLLQKIRPFSFAALLLLILLAFGLRLHNIDAFSFWTDEGLTPLRSGYTIPEILSNRVIIQQGITNDTHPPFFFLIIHYTRRLFGETDFAFRFPATLAGVLLVPLMFQFGRRLQNEWLGLTAALLTAVNPLYLWYANEARMYTIFVLLMAGASYVLWRAVDSQIVVSRVVNSRVINSRVVNNRQSSISNLQSPISNPSSPISKYLLLYVLLAGLGLYTHYTAVFLIGAQSVFWVRILWQRGQKRLILGTAALGVLAAIPLIPFTIPRLFHGAEANFYYVSPGIMLQDVVRFFGLGGLVDFKQLFIQLLTIGFFLLLLLGIFAAKTGLKRSFLVTYLYAIVFGLMLGSLIKPMYQGARHILAGSPAFILLVSWAIVWLWTVIGNRSSVIGKRLITDDRLPMTDYRFLITLLLTLVATAVPLIGTTLAINNLYTNPRYAKDSLRDVIRFVEQTAGENDVIVYNNAILLPLHAHYQQRQDVAVTASPIYLTWVVQTAPPQLEALAAAYERIWFITDPPANASDQNKFVEQWLNTNSVLIDEYPFRARNTRLSAIVFGTGPKYVPTVPETAVSQPHQWPNTPTLQGFRVTDQQPVSTPTLWVDLYWQGEKPAKTWLRFSLLGPDGREWALSEQSLITHPETDLDWPQDEIIAYSYPIQLPVGTPPGSYALMMQPFAADGGAYGDFQQLTDVTIADSGAWLDAVEQPYADYQSIHFQNGISLKGVELAASEVRPGHSLPLSIYWQAATDTVDLQNTHYTLTLRKPDGDLLTQTEGSPGAAWLSDWPVGVPIREPAGLHFPADAEPGHYSLVWQLWDGESAVRGRPFWQPWATQTITLGQVDVIPWPMETTLPEDGTLLQAQFGDAIQLHSYKLTKTAAALQLTLTWQAQTVPDKNYTVFIHLVDAAGNIVQQRDIIPVDGLRPTAGWRPDEVLTDVHTLSLSPDLAGGTYALRVGLYEPETFIRLPISYQGEMQPNDQLELTTLTRP